MTASTERTPEAQERAGAGPLRREALRLAVVGMSTTDSCGVRDHAVQLAAALARENVDCSLNWLNRRRASFGAARAEISAWAQDLAEALASERPDAVLLHYSVFAHSYRGIPVFVPPMLAAVRRAGVPLIALMHEFTFRQRGRSGPRVAIWSLSQRAALLAVMRASAATVLTVPERAAWLDSRRWLPRRPTAVAPVFSTLPPPTRSTERSGDRDVPLAGLFGYSYPQWGVSLVVETLALLRASGVPLRLVLLGAPGADSEVGARWLAATHSRAVAEALSFSGTVGAQQLADRLADCDLLLFADRPGPTSRKTTLAGSLASGRAVVATDGPESWKTLVDAGAVALVPPRADALAREIERLLGDEDLRTRLGARGRRFAEQNMGVGLSAAVVAELVRETLNGLERAAPATRREAARRFTL
jgi:glycosyltransferase involved in cell wall biosynthesis